MKCEKCDSVIEAGEKREHAGRTLCEDCYIDALSPVRSCDPWANFSAKSVMELSDGNPELTDTQKAILDRLTAETYVLPRDLADGLGLSQGDIQKEVATLRHMELARGARRGGRMFVTLYDTPHVTEDH